jgi:ubiquinone/menaquinone biosynthesis C-methylase UbiE
MSAAQLTTDQQARTDFALALRKRWSDTLYPALNTQTRAASPTGAPTDWREAEPLVHSRAVYPWFAWTERAAQKMMWRAVTEVVKEQGLEVPTVEGAELGSLELDPELVPPSYYTEWDIHIQPGGLWDSPEAALVYEQGSKIVMLGQNDDYGFHRLFTETAVPDGEYRRIVDLGCGFAKSTVPFKARFPEAEVVGVDLAGPVLQLGHWREEQRGTALRLRQADLTDTGLDAGSVDLLTATMVLHELPRSEQHGMLAEAARLLAPGGVLRVLDFHETGDGVRDLAMREHGERNNEPFMPVLFDTDVLGSCEANGLTNARWIAFDERGAGLLGGLSWPERAEWHFPWAVLAAEKPA